MDPASADRTTFTWTGAAALSRAPRLERDADRLGETIASACSGLFPRWAGYRVRQDRLHGAIRGRRYTIRRGRFVGQVSVQVFASGGAYRHGTEGPMRLRVDGRMRVEPPPPRPELPLAAITLGVAIVCVALLLFRIAGIGWVEIIAHPSVSRFVDGVGVLGAAGFALLGISLTKAVARHGAALPWARVRSELRAWLRWPWSIDGDRRRWSVLHEHLTGRLATASDTLADARAWDDRLAPRSS